nr:hypothetical protein [Tanacetum cinerariifolium]
MHDDIWEQILIRLDLEDLIRCESVCKSWKSLISHPRFIKAYHKRQVNLIPYRMAIIPNYFSKYGPEYYMVGSSNGLACINSFDGDAIIVANPWTREGRIMLKPKVHVRALEIHQPNKAIRECSFLANKEEYVCIYNGHRGNVWGTGKYSVKLYWENTWRNFYTLSGIASKEQYAFIPTTVMPSLISPYPQEGNE